MAYSPFGEKRQRLQSMSRQCKHLFEENMTPLLIPSIIERNWAALQSELTTVLILWLMVIGAVLTDLYVGIRRARALKEPIQSGKLRRTVGKISEYWSVMFLMLMIDAVCSLTAWYNIPYASMLGAVGCVVIEGISVLESLRAKKSAAAKLPQIIRDIVQCKDMDSAMELIEKIQNLNNKHHHDNEQ